MSEINLSYGSGVSLQRKVTILSQTTSASQINPQKAYQSSKNKASNAYQSRQSNASSAYQSRQSNASSAYQSRQSNASSAYQSRQSNNASTTRQIKPSGDQYDYWGLSDYGKTGSIISLESNIYKSKEFQSLVSADASTVFDDSQNCTSVIVNNRRNSISPSDSLLRYNRRGQLSNAKFDELIYERSSSKKLEPIPPVPVPSSSDEPEGEDEESSCDVPTMERGTAQKIKKSMKKSKCILTLFLIIFITAVPLFSFFDNELGKQKQDVTAYLKTSNVDPVTLLPASSSFDGISIICHVITVDVPNSNFKAAFSFIPSGSFASAFAAVGDLSTRSAQKKYLSLTKPIAMIIGSQTINFKANQPMPDQSLLMAFDTGNVNQYPFDQFSTSFLMIASSTEAQTLNATQVNLAFSIVGLAQAFYITPSFGTPVSLTTLIEVSVVASRSFTTRFFSLFIFSSLWILSFTIFALATTLWLRDRTVEPPTIGFCAGFLFALPAIRNAQPGAPPIGCTVDVAGFFWNIVLVMLATVLLMINYIKKRQREHK